MPRFSRVIAMAGMLLLAACGGSAPTGPGSASGWSLQDVSVRLGPEIGRTASGLEYRSNFVWNGYSDGNRKKQVIGLMRMAIGDAGRTAMTGSQPVRMKVTVNYFHALTDRSRVWCCGAHSIYADLEVVDAASGAVLASGQDVDLGSIALGGIPGLVAVAAGRDQDVRIREGITDGVIDWLAQY